MTEKQSLYIIAGANGSGKSTISNELINSICTKNIIPFDGDFYIKEYSRFCDDPHYVSTLVEEKFETEISKAIEQKQSFAYETNFHLDKPLETAQKFINSGYQINCIFIVAPNTEFCIERVNIRHKLGGHYVSPKEIEKRFWAGIENIIKVYNSFNNIFFFKNEEKLAFMLHIQDGKIKYINDNQFIIKQPSYNAIKKSLNF